MFIAAKSPVFGMVTSSLSGIATIRSAGAQNRLIHDFDNHQVKLLNCCSVVCILSGLSQKAYFLKSLYFLYFVLGFAHCLLERISLWRQLFRAVPRYPLSYLPGCSHFRVHFH